ncbi:MAG: formimidoylglutamate deiminase [Candidatus Nanopelagicales bacterium]
MAASGQTTRRLHARQAWLGDDTVAQDVLIEITGGVITAVTPGVPEAPDAEVLSGLTLPGLQNTHSHVFHRAIRGHTQVGAADFWAWRDLMYGVAERLNPENLYALALATYGEMALAGITTVGEFFYVHNDLQGMRYTDPNELGKAVAAAAADAGIRMTLLDTCYLQGDVKGAQLVGAQRRFDDGSWERWAERVDPLQDSELLKIGAAIHSVRAVPQEGIAGVAEFASARGMPLHMHLSEQPAENAACLAHFGCTPTELMHRSGALGPLSTAVHATHLTDHDIELLGATRTHISMCCTTERDLADGVGPALRLSQAGAPLCLGSDGHMQIDLLEEARAMELDERLVSLKRGHFSARLLAAAATQQGASSLGWNSGRIAVGATADLITITLDSPRTAGAGARDPLAPVLFSATASDVRTVIVGGRTVVANGEHQFIEDVGRALDHVIGTLLTSGR